MDKYRNTISTYNISRQIIAHLYNAYHKEMLYTINSRFRQKHFVSDVVGRTEVSPVKTCLMLTTYQLISAELIIHFCT